MAAIERLRARLTGLSAPAKASIVFMFASFFQQGLNVITTPIFTRIMSPADYGVISVYTSWQAMLIIVATLTLSGGVFNVGMLEYRDDRPGYASSLLLLSGAATLILAGVYLIFRGPADRLIQLPPSLILLMFLTFLLSPSLSFWTARQRYEFKYKLSASVTVASSLLSTAVSVAAVVSAKKNLPQVRLWSAGAVMLAFDAFFYAYIFIKGRKGFDRRYWSFALRFNLPLIPHYLSAYVLSGSDRILISLMVGSAEAGIYGLVYSISIVISLVWTAINGSLGPLTYERMKAKRYADIDRVAKSVLFLLAILCLLVVLFAPEIIRVLATPAYYRGVYVVPPVIAGTFFTALYSLFVNIEFYYKKTVMVMFATIVAAALNIGLNVLLIPRFGYLAAAYTTLAAYIVYALTHYLNMRRMQETKIYDSRFLVAISVSVTVLCLLCNLLYTRTLLRYGIAAAGVVLLAVFRKKVVGMIRSVRVKKQA